MECLAFRLKRQLGQTRLHIFLGPAGRSLYEAIGGFTQALLRRNGAGSQAPARPGSPAFDP